MKPYYLNLIALALTLGAWLVARLGYWLLPKAWDSAPFYLGLLVYLSALAALGWGSVRAVWLAIQGTLPLGKGLLVVGLSLVQGVGTLFFFLILLAEGFKKEN